MAQEIVDLAELEDRLNEEGLSVVHFSTPGRFQKYQLNEFKYIANAFQESCNFFIVFDNECPEAVEKYSAESTPFIQFENGEKLRSTDEVLKFSRWFREPDF